MWFSKFRFRWHAPRADDGTLMPAVLAGIIVCTIMLQVLWTEPEPVAQLSAPMRRRAAPMPPTMDLVQVDSRINADAIFAPRGRTRPGGQNAERPNAPLDGITVAGAVSVGSRTAIVIRHPAGGTANVPVGGRVAGWTVAAIGPESATFVRHRQRLVVTYGAAATPSEPGDAN